VIYEALHNVVAKGQTKDVDKHHGQKHGRIGAEQGRGALIVVKKARVVD